MKIKPWIALLAATLPAGIFAQIPAGLDGLAGGYSGAWKSTAGMAAPEIDIEVEQESQVPFARWRLRSGAILIFVERMPATPVFYRVRGPGIELEIGSRPSSFPNYYIRGGGQAVLNNPFLSQILLRIVLEERP